MNFYSIIEMLTGLCEAVVTFMLFENYMCKRDNMPEFVNFIGVVALATGINAVNTVLNYNILNPVCVIALMFVFSFIYKPDAKKGIIVSIVSVVISACSEVIILYVITVLNHGDKTQAYLDPSLRVLGIVLSKTLSLSIIKVICLFSKKNKFRMPLLYWIIYSSVFAVNIAAIYLIFAPYSNGNSAYMQAICSIGLLYNILVTLYLYEHMTIQEEKLKEKELLESQFNAQVNHLKELILAQEQISVYHDLANHMVSLKSYLDHHNYEEGNAYLARLLEKTDMYSDIINTGNIVIDAIITSKQNLARQDNIDFTFDLQIPENLKINSADCCVILGNALDNAIEACGKVQNKRYINMKMAYHNDTLSCKITNPVPEEYKKNKQLKTTKGDAQNHGIGTKNIKKILDKYKSAYRMEYENGEFVFAFILYDIFTKV